MNCGSSHISDYSGNPSGARRARKRSSGDSPVDSQTVRSSGRQINVRVKRTNNPSPGQVSSHHSDSALLHNNARLVRVLISPSLNSTEYSRGISTARNLKPLLIIIKDSQAALEDQYWWECSAALQLNPTICLPLKWPLTSVMTIAFSFRVKERPQTQRRKTTSQRKSTGSVKRPDARPRTQCVLRARQRGGCNKINLEGRTSSVLNQSKRLCPSSPPPQVCQKRIHVSLVSSVVWGTFLQWMFRSLLQKVTSTEPSVFMTAFTKHASGQRLFCGCVFTGSHKDGYEIFATWKRVWTSNGKSEPSLKAFMADQQLPYWVNKRLPCLSFLWGGWMWRFEWAGIHIIMFSVLGSMHKTRLSKVAPAHERNHAHCFVSSDVPLRHEIKQHQGNQQASWKKWWWTDRLLWQWILFGVSQSEGPDQCSQPEDLVSF